jgi:hypothetical protein
MRFLALFLAAALSGCTRYALRSEADRYIPPAGLAPRAAQAGDRPVVLLIPGSMIVGDFYDVLAPWLESQGFWPVVYTAPDLISGPIRDAAPWMAEAIKVSAEASGQRRIHVIAECDGGIATRYAVEKLGADRQVDRLVTFVSAHGGTRGFPITWFPALRDIQPDSELVWEMAHSRLPPGSGTTAFTLSFCDDEVMKPHTTSAYPGAVNIAICDPGVFERARERTPPDVHHRLGQAMIPRYRQHFAGFWDEEVFLLYRLLLTGEVAEVQTYDRLQLEVSDDR